MQRADSPEAFRNTQTSTKNRSVRTKREMSGENKPEDRPGNSKKGADDYRPKGRRTMNAAIRPVALVIGVLSLTAILTTAVAAEAATGKKAGGPAATTALILAGGAGWQ
ncbi:hypothetical protein [Streptosporangium amethystogenes]|uniref:hypothetical protein n=1 Tax=Streptosporangium amethystogenes TaxID=2002 RepID=UPI0012FBD7F1|nr:hypothetical protein [Streptosporangium amethystogenes]